MMCIAFASCAEKETKVAIGVQSGTTGESFLKGDADWGFEGFANVDTKAYDNAGLAVEDMKNGNIKYVVIDAAVGKELASKNDTIKVSAETYAGAIAGSADGYILNCYTYDNRFSVPSGSYKIGSITGSSTYNTKLTIENCYIYHKQNSSNWGAAVGLPYKVTLNNFFHNKGKAFHDKTSDKAKTYDSSFCIDGNPITDLLNTWIGEDTTFNTWTMSNGIPCFQ